MAFQLTAGNKITQGISAIEMLMDCQDDVPCLDFLCLTCGAHFHWEPEHSEVANLVVANKFHDWATRHQVCVHYQAIGHA